MPQLYEITTLSNSSRAVWDQCKRKYGYAYAMRRRPAHEPEHLAFGKAMHRALYCYHSLGEAAAARALSNDQELGFITELQHVQAWCLMAGYDARWGTSQPLRYEHRELKFRLPILGSRLVHVGERDLIAWLDALGEPKLFNVEHKTTSRDISPGSDYWRHVMSLDSQVSVYQDASSRDGKPVEGTIYDVIRKPSFEPQKATPEDAKKYTVPTRKDPTPRLYKGMRETDESIEEYRLRLLKDISERPWHYYARQIITRTKREIDEHLNEVQLVADGIERAVTASHSYAFNAAYPRSPSQCNKYGSLCAYHDVCSGIGDIDGPAFVTKEETEVST